MNNKEKINAMSVEELGNKLCDLVKEVLYRAEKKNSDFEADCDYCPAQHFCQWGKAGFITMLEQEAEETK